MNAETKRQLSKAIKLLESNKPSIWDEDSGSIYQSRRIKGMYTISGDRHGYRHVYCYVEKGLSEHEHAIHEVLKAAIRTQNKSSYSNSCLFIGCFGGENDELRYEKDIVRLKGTLDLREIISCILKLSGSQTATEHDSSVIKSLFPIVKLNYTELPPPKPKDILLFFRSNKNLYLEKKVRSRYIRQLKLKSIWITFDGEDISIVHGKKVKPDEWKSAPEKEEVIIENNQEDDIKW
jgi:hypothetical protein